LRRDIYIQQCENKNIFESIDIYICTATGIHVPRTDPVLPFVITAPTAKPIVSYNGQMIGA
jgi:hypothetical protein